MARAKSKAVQPAVEPLVRGDLIDICRGDEAELVEKLKIHQLTIFPPLAQKYLRRFTTAEAAGFIGVAEGYLRQLVAEKRIPVGESKVGRRTFSAEEINEIRRILDTETSRGRYIPHRREGDKVHIITVSNFKGGSGKTTTSAHLAQYLALRGFRVLAIDLDPQASLSAFFGVQSSDVPFGDSLYGAIRYRDPRPLAHIVRESHIPNLHFVPGHLELHEFEFETSVVTSSDEGGEGRAFYGRIRSALATLEDNYDVIIIDCMPHLGFLTLSAMCAATSYIVTVGASMLDVDSMQFYLKMLGELMQAFQAVGNDTSCDWFRYLITRYEPGDLPQKKILNFLHSIMTERILTAAQLKSTAIADASMSKQTLYEVDRGDFIAGTYDRAMESVNAVNSEIEKLILRTWGRSV